MNREDDPQVRDDERARARQAQNFRDFIAEAAGLRNGWRLRFHNEAETPRGREARQQERERLQNLTLTAQQRYQQLRQRLDELERASAEALRKAEGDLRELQDRAAVDEQGRRMYRTENGQTAYYEDGTEVSRETQDRTDFTGRPTWEGYQTTEQGMQEAKRNHEQVQEAQHLADTGQLAPDEMETVVADLEDVTSANVVAALSGQSRVGMSAAREHMPAPNNNLTARHSFNQAGSDGSVIQEVRNDPARPQPAETFKP